MADFKAITVTQKPWLTLGHASTVLYTKHKINHSYLVWLNVSQRVFHCQQQTQILKKKTKKIKATSQVLLKPRQALLNFLQYSDITCDHCKLSNFETGTTYNEQQFFIKPFLMVIITLSCHQIAIYVYRLSQSLFVYKCSTDRELFLSLSTATCKLFPFFSSTPVYTNGTGKFILLLGLWHCEYPGIRTLR